MACKDCAKDILRLSLLLPSPVFLLKTFISLFSGLNFPKLILINWKTVPIAGKALLVGWQNRRRRRKAFALSREEEKVFPPSTDKTIKHDKCCAWRQRGGIVTRHAVKVEWISSGVGVRALSKAIYISHLCHAFSMISCGAARLSAGALSRSINKSGEPLHALEWLIFLLYLSSPNHRLSRSEMLRGTVKTSSDEYAKPRKGGD